MGAEREIIQVVVGNDETELFDFRLSYLQGFVDFTYVGEARFTHTFEPKTLNFREYRVESARKDWEPIEIPLEDSIRERGSWAFERHSRDWLVREISARHPDSILVICDMDEIPSREQLEWARVGFPRDRAMALPMKLAYRRANWCFNPSGNLWTLAKIVHGKGARDGVRLLRRKWAPGEPGIHLSYVGMNPERIARKLVSFPHQEFANAALASAEFIAFCDEFKLDHFGRIYRWGKGTLRVEPTRTLNGVQKELLEFRPRWFDFEPAPPRRNCIDAAVAVHRYVRKVKKGNLGGARIRDLFGPSGIMTRIWLGTFTVANSLRNIGNVFKFG